MTPHHVILYTLIEEKNEGNYVGTHSEENARIN